LAHAEVVVPQSSVAIDGLRYSYTYRPTFVANGKRPLLSSNVDGGPSRLRFCAGKGQRGSCAVAPVSSVGSVVPLEGDDVLVRVRVNTLPPAWYVYSRPTGELKRTAAGFAERRSPSTISEVVREICHIKGRHESSADDSLAQGHGTRRQQPTHLTVMAASA